MEHIDNPIRFYRLLKGISVVDMAKHLGISRWTYNAREEDPDSLTISQARKIAEHLDIPIDVLFRPGNPQEKTMGGRP